MTLNMESLNLVQPVQRLHVRSFEATIPVGVDHAWSVVSADCGE